MNYSDLGLNTELESLAWSVNVTLAKAATTAHGGRWRVVTMATDATGWPEASGGCRASGRASELQNDRLFHKI